MSDLSIATHIDLQTWASADRALPKAPVMGWRELVPARGAVPPALGDLPHRTSASSGRAALLAALRQAGAGVGSRVLVASYHCPTMVAPILRAGATPVFYPIGDDGLPQLDAIADDDARRARVMFVAHYFGLPRSLRRVRDWCDERAIVLVEDCAHAFFGFAGERPVGTWGDYAIASLAKFFPVAEGGLLASARHPLTAAPLAAPPLRTEIKGALDVVEIAHRFGRLPGPTHAFAPWYWLKSRRRPTAPPAPVLVDVPPLDLAEMTADCDMGRVEQRASATARTLAALLPRARLVERRRRNFAAYAVALAGADRARPLWPALPDGAAPYAFPLWVDDARRADHVYAAIRMAQLPVFRWDRAWPGTPRDAQDSAVGWSRQVLQLLCHQGLGPGDIAAIADTIQRILRAY